MEARYEIRNENNEWKIWDSKKEEFLNFSFVRYHNALQVCFHLNEDDRVAFKGRE